MLGLQIIWSARWPRQAQNGSVLAWRGVFLCSACQVIILLSGSFLFAWLNFGRLIEPELLLALYLNHLGILDYHFD